MSMSEIRMDELIDNFPQQLSEALQIGRAAKFTAPKVPINNVVVTGLGGSGIGGNLVGDLVESELQVPFNVNKDYFLPNYVGENTLVIASSYSGNTEETLSAFEIALRKNAKIVCISSNGTLLEAARQYGLDSVTVPGGNPPRASLGYSVVQQLFTLYGLNLISNAFELELESTIKLLNEQKEDIQFKAKAIAAKLVNKIPIIYATTPMATVAVRFRQQINENGKMLCWHHVIPEMNHNELVGWRIKSEQWVVIFLRSDADDYERNQQRIAINKEIIGEYAREDNIIDIQAEGASFIQRAFYLIHLTDWVSFYLAELHGVDPVEVDVIDFLKGSLAGESVK